MSQTRKKVVLVVIPIAFLIALSILAARSWQPSAQASPFEHEKEKSKAAAKEKADKEEKDKTALAEFMHAKLDASTEILEGLLMEDEKKIIKGAEKMREMSQAEKWRISNDMMYRHHSEDFRRNVDKLITSAKGNSIDRAALNWFDVTLSCIDCHRWVRRVLIAEADDPFQP